jgi:hypothetical protein
MLDQSGRYGFQTVFELPACAACVDVGAECPLVGAEEARTRIQEPVGHCHAKPAGRGAGAAAGAQKERAGPCADAMESAVTTDPKKDEPEKEMRFKETNRLMSTAGVVAVALDSCAESARIDPLILKAV